MHNNYFFLRQLAPALEARLKGYSLVSCFSQNKEELVLEFNDSQSSIFLRADLSPSFSCLSFPVRYARSGKNSVDLFSEIILLKVTGVRTYANERSFSIELEDHYQVLFKMHGNRANIVLFKGDSGIGIFRHQLDGDLAIRLNNLDRTIDWGKEAFLQNLNSLSNLYFTFGKPVWQELAVAGFGNADIEGKWGMVQTMVSQLEAPDFFICNAEEGVVFRLWASQGECTKFDDPITAITEFYSRAKSTQTFYHERMKALRDLEGAHTLAEVWLTRTRAKLLEILQDNRYKTWGDLIMANLYRIDKGTESVLLEDFRHGNEPVQVPLKKTLTPQKNAELYYRKGKNQHIEQKKLEESIDKKEKELDRVRTQLGIVRDATDLRALRKAISEPGFLPKKNKDKEEALPYREFDFNGFLIWVGRNAQSNDTLTLKYSFKDDLWLHAKDVAGSHVLLKYQSGKNFPKDVIERAAQLAAFYSKRKNEGLCPVAFTQKKYVRKRKGDPAGAVVVEREEVILVTPLG